MYSPFLTKKEGVITLTETELYETLIEKGVPESYIQEMKETPNQSCDPYERYYDYSGKTTFEKVPLSKVKGLGFRGTPGLSWFNHACYKETDNIDVGRCQRAFNFLKGQTLEEFHKYYQTSTVRLIYFEDDDFYTVGGDGTHRTLYAKVTGASSISAKVDYYKKDPLAFEAYQQFLDMAPAFEQLLTANHLTIKDDYRAYRFSPEFYYKGEFLFSRDIYTPDMFIYKSNLKMEVLEEWYAQQQVFKEDMLKIQQYRNKFHLIRRLTPKKWLPKIVSFLKFWIQTVSSSDIYKKRLYQLREDGFRMFCIDTGFPHYF